MNDLDDLIEAAHDAGVRVACGHIRRRQGSFIPFEFCIPSEMWESTPVPKCVQVT
jgi:hypothetical protein